MKSANFELEIYESNRIQLYNQEGAGEGRMQLQPVKIWGKIQETAALCNPERAQKHYQTPSQYWRRHFGYNLLQKDRTTLRCDWKA